LGRFGVSASASQIGIEIGEPLPARLRRLREECGMSRSELAERTGLSRPTIWAWESGRTQPRQSNLQMLANALGIAEIDLVGRSDTAAYRFDQEMIGPEVWQNNEIPDGLANPQRLSIMIHAARLAIAALAGIKSQNVKISIEL